MHAGLPETKFSAKYLKPCATNYAQTTTLILHTDEAVSQEFKDLIKGTERPSTELIQRNWCDLDSIVLQLSKCLKFEAVWGVLTDQMI